MGVGDRTAKMDNHTTETSHYAAKTDNHQSRKGIASKDLRDWGILGILWLLGAGIDQVWLALDHRVPSWDPADHLIGALNYWWTLQPQHWFTGHIWTALWTLSTKYPPLLYLSTAPFFALFGQGADQAIAVNLLYTAILLGSVYGLGRILFRAEVGLWAAGLCLLFPQFYSLRTGYYMDYPLTSLVAASTFTLILWYRSHANSKFQWFLALGFGFTFGLALLSKQTAVFFLALPLLWMGFHAVYKGIRQRSWYCFGQLLSGLFVSLLMILPWSQSSWLFQISAVFNSNIRSAKIEGDPSWNTIAGWTYYWQHLPAAISYPLLIVPIVGLILGLIQFLMFPHKRQYSALSPSPTSSASPTVSLPHSFPILFFFLFLGSAYAIWSAIANKDSRYIMPWLSLWSIVLAYGLLSFPRKLHWVKWAAVGLSSAVMMINLFPVGGTLGRAIAHPLTPGAYHQPYLGQTWPHSEIIEDIIATQPYQIANVGVLPSTPEINQHNLNFEGNRHNFQVYARRMGKDRDYLERDTRSLSWFISVTPPNLNHHEEKSRKRQKEVIGLLKQSGDFKRHRVWELPDGSKLKLFRRKTLPVEVKPLDNAIANVLYDSEQLNALLALFTPSHTNTSKRRSSDQGSSGGSVRQMDGPSGSPGNVTIQPMRVQLDEVTIPQRTPPGHPVPVTYQWSGSWEMLHNGLVFLTWHRLRHNETIPATSNDRNSTVDERAETVSDRPTMTAPIYPSNRRWFHDHRIGMGTLYPQVIQANQAIASSSTIDPLKPFVVTEHTAMLPPADLNPGRYVLEATYVNSQTQETYPIDVPPVLLKVRPNATPKDAPELDWLTQLRQLAPKLSLGIDALGPVFESLGRVNLYDPVQAYVQDGEEILKWRLQHHPNSLDDVYGLTLAQALQQDVQGAIAALERAVELDDQNPYTYAELAFVNLYAGRPWTAQKSLDTAMNLDPTVPEIQILDAIAAAMRGNLWQAWQRYQSLSR